MLSIVFCLSSGDEEREHYYWRSWQWFNLNKSNAKGNRKGNEKRMMREISGTQNVCNVCSEWNRDRLSGALSHGDIYLVMYIHIWLVVVFKQFLFRFRGALQLANSLIN